MSLSALRTNLPVRLLPSYLSAAKMKGMTSTWHTSKEIVAFGCLVSWPLCLDDNARDDVDVTFTERGQLLMVGNSAERCLESFWGIT
jgi:hypothetical protein